MHSHLGILNSFQHGPQQIGAFQTTPDQARPSLVPTAGLTFAEPALRIGDGIGGVTSQAQGHMGTQFSLHKISYDPEGH